jgi:hypothetical protein
MGVMDRNRLRASYGRRVAAMIAYDVNFAGRFHVRDAHGRRVVVPVLEDDTVAFVAGLVRRSGGEAVLAVPIGVTDAGSRVKTVAFSVSPEDREDCDNDVPVGIECTIGDVLKVLAVGTSMTLRIGGGELSFDDLGQTHDALVA